MPGYDQDIKVNTKFLKIEAGEPHDIRLLNSEPIEIYSHQVPNAKPEICTGDSCHLCENGNEPRQRFLTNIYDHNSGKVKIFEYGSMIGKQLKEIYKTLLEEDRKITDVDLKVSATGSNLSKRYQIMPRGTSKAVPSGLQLHDLVGDGKIFETGGDGTPF
jgi:hypothetical protein